MRIVIAGAAGAAGRRLLGALTVREVEVIALSHSDAGEQRLREAGATSLVRADLADPSQLAEAFAGADAVHVIPPALHPLEDVFAEHAVRAAAEAGVARLVYHSVMHPHTPQLRNHMRKAKAEAAVRHSGLRWTILQPSMFAQVVLLMFSRGVDGDVAVPFNPDSRVAVLDLEELSEVAARTLTEDGHDYATYELAGPLTSLAEMIAQIAAVNGEPLRARQVPVAEGPLPPIAAENAMAAADMISTYAYYDQHGFQGNSRMLELLLGRPPATFAQIARRELGRG